MSGQIEETHWPVLSLSPTYRNIELRSMRDVKAIFPAGEADAHNWLFIGTSGVHGTGITLDQAAKILKRSEDAIAAPLVNGKTYITVLVVHPRLVVMKYGEILVSAADVKLLRKLVRSTIQSIADTQDANT